MATTVTRVTHPAFTPSDIARMPATVRHLLRDTLDAHQRAREDYRRDSMFSRLNRQPA